MDVLSFPVIEPIRKGWSDDQKYRVTDANGARYLLRVSPLAQQTQKKFEFDHMTHLAALGVPMCRPIRMGVCETGVYALHEWIDGEDAETVIPALPDSRQYAYGLDAGRALRLIHTLPAPETCEDWQTRYSRKLDRKIKLARACPVQPEYARAFINFAQNNRHCLADRPQCFQHGDYHIGNMMIDGSGRLVVIDFNRCDFGDPWEEFNRIV